MIFVIWGRPIYPNVKEATLAYTPVRGTIWACPFFIITSIVLCNVIRPFLLSSFNHSQSLSIIIQSLSIIINHYHNAILQRWHVAAFGRGPQGTLPPSAKGRLGQRPTFKVASLEHKPDLQGGQKNHIYRSMVIYTFIYSA